MPLNVPGSGSFPLIAISGTMQQRVRRRIRLLCYALVACVFAAGPGLAEADAAVPGGAPATVDSTEMAEADITARQPAAVSQMLTHQAKAKAPGAKLGDASSSAEGFAAVGSTSVCSTDFKRTCDTGFVVANDFPVVDNSGASSRLC